MLANTPVTAASNDQLTQIHRFGDAVLLVTLVCSSLATIAIGQYYGDLAVALGGGATLLLIGLAAFLLGRGRALGWLALTTCNAAAVALHIHLARGSLEFHFGVFVLLGMLLV